VYFEVFVSNSRSFRHPDDFFKLHTLKQRFTVEKTAIDAQLKAAMQAELDDVHRGMDMLETMTQDKLRIEQDLERVERLADESQKTISNYPTIRVVRFVDGKLM